MINVRNASECIEFGCSVNLREHVVHNVVLDDAMEHVAADEAEVTVDSGCCALEESPLVGFVVGSLRMGVMKIRNGD